MAQINVIELSIGIASNKDGIRTKIEKIYTGVAEQYGDNFEKLMTSDDNFGASVKLLVNKEFIVLVESCEQSVERGIDSKTIQTLLGLSEKINNIQCRSFRADGNFGIAEINNSITVISNGLSKLKKENSEEAAKKEETPKEETHK